MKPDKIFQLMQVVAWRALLAYQQQDRPMYDRLSHIFELLEEDLRTIKDKHKNV